MNYYFNSVIASSDCNAGSVASERSNPQVGCSCKKGIASVAHGAKAKLLPRNDGMVTTLALSFLLVANLTFGQTFSPVSTNLPNVRDGASAWGDYDNDGDLDLLLTGIQDDHVAVAKVFRNDSTGFTDVNANLTAVFFSSVAWGDYDNDGRLDILLTGRAANASPVSKIYHNNGDGTFTDINAPLTPVEKSSVDWGDFDNDGDLDILLAGATSSSEEIAVIYDNDTFDFELFDVGLPGISEGTAAWADYDNDGDNDILLTGSGIAKVFRNDGAISFVDIGAALQGVVASASAWGDYDNDGDLDILITGSYFADVYTNAGLNVFNALNLPLSKGVARSSVSWGDYDNDGDLDFTISGDDNTLNRTASLCRNDGGGAFTDITSAFSGLWYSNTACGDFNNDGKLDVLMSGEDSLFNASTVLYENTDSNANTIPVTPANLNATELPHRVILSWDEASDTETPDSALTYNIYIGRAASLSEFVSAMSEIPSGYRRVMGVGEQGNNRVWSVNDLPKDKYYWAVQSVDNNYAGSPFAAMDSFEICKNTNVNLGPDTTLCYGVVYTLDGGLGLTGYNWSTGETTQTIRITQAGTYHVTVESADGCHAIDTVVIDYYPPMIVDAGEDATINLNYSTQLQATGGVVYEWSPSESLDNALIDNPVASPLLTTLYHVTVTDGNNCSSVDSVTVTVILEPIIKVPNFISPNGDRILDVLEIDGIRSYPGNTMIVFNRWGDIVYEVTDYQDNWGGTVENTSLNLWGEEVPEGVYFYKLSLNNGKAPLAGSITVKK